jgi:hypothetical protein
MPARWHKNIIGEFDGSSLWSGRTRSPGLGQDRPNTGNGHGSNDWKDCLCFHGALCVILEEFNQ